MPKSPVPFGNLEEVILQGLIVGNISNLYKIEYEEKIYEAVAKGKFKLENITPVVGDIVEFEITDKETKKAIIIRKRIKIIKNVIILPTPQPPLFNFVISSPSK